MNLIKATRQAIERRMSISDLDGIMDMIASGGAPSYTGKLVSQKNSLSVSAVWSCVNVLADDWATLPLLTYRWQVPGESREEARDHYLWPILHDQANPRMSSHRFKRVMEMWRQLWGNAYAEIEFNGRGQIVALWPWRPDRVKVWLEDPSDVRSRVIYSYMPLDRNINPITLTEDHILHIRNTSIDGIVGLSPIEIHRQTVGLMMAMQEHAGRFYGNSAVIKGVLEHPGKLGDKGIESLKESLKQYQGVQNSHRMLILEEGMKFNDVGMKMEDAQFIESNKFNIAEIARMFNVPLHRLKELDRATNNNIEQLAMEYVQYTLGPNAANWCGEIHSSLLSVRERNTIFVEPDYTHLLMADHKSRGDYYTALANASALSPDEIREKEGYNPLPNGAGKLPRAPLNTISINKADQVPVSTTPDANKKPNGVGALLQ